MDGSAVVPGLTGIQWGTATSDALCRATRGAKRRPLWPTAGHADLWSEAVESLTGQPVTIRRAVLGWRHLQPDGPGSWDAAALSRVDAALDDLLERGLTPAVTLFHMDLPAWVGQDGGWMSRTTATRFADYAAAMGERFGDRVGGWVTSTDLSAPSLADHVAGMFPPGRARGLAGLASVHHVLLGHGLATIALRAAGVSGDIGTTIALYGGYPATGDPWDRLAVEEFETWGNSLFLDPLLLGRHLGEEGETSWVERTGCARDGDLDVISTPVDVLGLSWHESNRIAAPENLPMLLPADGGFGPLNQANRLLAPLGFALAPFDDVETNRYGWPIIPEGLADALVSLQDRYGAALPALHVIDNGMGDLQVPGESGDADRYRTLLGRRLTWLARAVGDGIDVRWYEYWSVLDNLTWKSAYARLYARSVCSQEAEVLPRPPRDWAGSAALDLLSPVPRPKRGRRTGTAAVPRLGLHHV